MYYILCSLGVYKEFNNVDTWWGPLGGGGGSVERRKGVLQLGKPAPDVLFVQMIAQIILRTGNLLSYEISKDSNEKEYQGESYGVDNASFSHPFSFPVFNRL